MARLSAAYYRLMRERNNSSSLNNLRRTHFEEYHWSAADEILAWALGDVSGVCETRRGKGQQHRASRNGRRGIINLAPAVAEARRRMADDLDEAISISKLSHGSLIE